MMAADTHISTKDKLSFLGMFIAVFIAILSTPDMRSAVLLYTLEIFGPCATNASNGKTKLAVMPSAFIDTGSLLRGG
jgi:hypothetical protein